MTELPIQAATGELLAVLREAFEGPERWSYFTDMLPESGLLHTLAPITAEEASRTIGGTSIAAHTRHLIHGMRVSATRIAGDRTSAEWRESWHSDPVDDAEWADILDGIREAYTVLREAIEEHAEDSAESFGDALGAIAHAVYHLGAIRSKIACERG